MVAERHPREIGSDVLAGSLDTVDDHMVLAKRGRVRSTPLGVERRCLIVDCFLAIIDLVEHHQLLVVLRFERYPRAVVERHREIAVEPTFRGHNDRPGSDGREPAVPVTKKIP